MGLTMQFEFATANRILFGCGTLNQTANIVLEMGSRCFVMTGGGSVSIEPLTRLLNQAGVLFDSFLITGEPDIASILAGVEKAKTFRCDFIIGFGGGSVIDSAKAVAALLNNPGELMDYLEVIGRGKRISNPPLPVVAIPTTAGTGSEVTRNAVITSREQHVKVSMRSPMMIPDVAIVDPELTISMPPSVTASTGLDALTQVFEAYVSNRANPMTDVIAREGIRRGARSLLTAYRDGENIQAREDMALTSLFGGITLANSGLGAVHGFAGPIGGLFDVPHGLICASLLPHVIKYNVKALDEKDEYMPIKKRFQEVAQILTGEPDAKIEDGVRWITNLAEQLEIPGLRSIGVEQSDFEEIVEKAKVSSSMKKNPVKLDDLTLRSILQDAY